MLVLAIGHGDHVAPPKVQLARLLWHKVVQRLHENLLRHHILQLDVLRPGHAGRAVVVDQLVQGIEFDHPQEELALCIAQHLKVLDAVRAPAKRVGSNRSRSVFVCRVNGSQEAPTTTYLTESEKSPGLDSLIRIRNAPSCLFDNNFSASALVIRP